MSGKLYSSFIILGKFLCRFLLTPALVHGVRGIRINIWAHLRCGETWKKRKTRAEKEEQQAPTETIIRFRNLDEGKRESRFLPSFRSITIASSESAKERTPLIPELFLALFKTCS